MILSFWSSKSLSKLYRSLLFHHRPTVIVKTEFVIQTVITITYSILRTFSRLTLRPPLLVFKSTSRKHTLYKIVVGSPLRLIRQNELLDLVSFLQTRPKYLHTQKKTKPPLTLAPYLLSQLTLFFFTDPTPKLPKVIQTRLFFLFERFLHLHTGLFFFILFFPQSNTFKFLFRKSSLLFCCHSLR